MSSTNIWLILLNVLISVCSARLQCHFFDSINITNGYWQLPPPLSQYQQEQQQYQQQVQNRSSIIFDGVEFRWNQYAMVNYTEDDGMRNVTLPHLRGCLCKIKPCHRLCCSNELLTAALPLPNDTVKSLEDKCNEELNQIENEVFDESSNLIILLLGNTIIKFDDKICLPFFVNEDYMNVMYIKLKFLCTHTISYDS